MFIFLVNNARIEHIKQGKTFGSFFGDEILQILKESDFKCQEPDSQELIHGNIDTDIYLLQCGFSPTQVIVDILKSKVFSHNDLECEHSYCQASPGHGRFVRNVFLICQREKFCITLLPPPNISLKGSCYVFMCARAIFLVQKLTFCPSLVIFFL